MSKKHVARRKHTGTNQSNHGSGRKKRPGVVIGFLKRIPSWGWWIGGLAIVAVYIWLFYYFFVGPFGFRWRALYGDTNYPDGYEIHGIDISHHQGHIDWDELKDKGMIGRYPVRFVMIKATEGATRTDENFRENFHQAREYGFTRGAYHFYSVHSPAARQAQNFISQVKLENGDLPPVLDVEHKPNEQTDEEFKASVLKWLDLVEWHYKVKPIIYTYYKFKMKYLSDPVFDQYPYWIAHYYVDSVEYKGRWKFWQHTDVGKLPGIKGHVDFNIYNGSYYDLRQMTIGSMETIGEKAYSE